MKILALRVKNLTSLDGEITIDFEAPPLARAGLFAITGPTGAGKSTLLDALCLALYDELPRLIQGGDVKSVLRHGAAHAYAEVDFIGRDGGRYRARWDVRRARNRADGKIQAQSVALTELASGVALGGTKRETLKAVEDKVGLDYNQFRRSVLLAQNDFDAFLRAKADERAGLLELMTGTAVYGELSKAAYDRSKTEDAALKALDEELKRVNVLADDERAAVEIETEVADKHAARLCVEIDELSREVEWHRVFAVLTGRVGEAETLLGDAVFRAAEGRPEQERLLQMRRALALSPHIIEVERLSAETLRLEDESAQAVQALSVCDAALTKAADLRVAARLADEQAETAFKAAGPALDRAADLDSRLADAQNRVRLSGAAAEQSADLAAQAGRNAERLAVERQDVAETLARLDSWIAAHQERSPLVEQADRWLEIISEHAKAAADHHAALIRAAASGQSLTDLTSRMQADHDVAAKMTARLESISQGIAALDAQLDAVDLESLAFRRDGLDALNAALSALESLAASASALDRRAREFDERRRAADARQARSRRILMEMESALKQVRSALPEAQAALALAEAAETEQSVVLRQRLLDGEPCPVCGSRDHPLDQIHTALTGLLDSLRQRVDDLESERDELLVRQTEAAAEALSADEILTNAAADAASVAEERRTLTDCWAPAVERSAALAAQWGVALSSMPSTLPVALDLDRDRAFCEAERNKIGENLRISRLADSDRRRLGQEREALLKQAQHLAQERMVAAQSFAELTAENRAAQTDADRAAAAVAQAVERLAAPMAVLGDWRNMLRNPDALAERVSRLAAEWRGALGRRDAERENERSLASKCGSAAAGLQNANHNAAKDRLVWEDEQAARDRLAAARAAIFDGRPTADMRTLLNNARMAGKAKFQHSQDAWAAAAQARSVAENRVKMLAAAQSTKAADFALAADLRDERLTQAGICLDQVREAMALGEEWMAGIEARQAGLREAETAARAVVAERRQALADHAAEGRPERGAEEPAALLPARIAERDGARERLAQLRRLLAEDDRNRGAVEETRRRIADQRKHHDLWKGMADLIGAADGKKFRLFAQGLTLDRLLALANLHLTELTPRYVLQRAPGVDLDLQVIDRDMADEVRGVANLSGGERFLVSLSLALGLAGMTGSRIIAESLFIDEGFGALDADSLDVAIAALETLHASGRKVGVISHVQPMIDRIGVQIRVAKLGGGRSVVEIKTAAALSP